MYLVVLLLYTYVHSMLCDVGRGGQKVVHQTATLSSTNYKVSPRNNVCRLKVNQNNCTAVHLAVLKSFTMNNKV